ncbi:MAG TPA: tRNA pseudouridine(55) synthase TruB [Phnomibacter sp.]|nr:tRNA pseudouridine(55) synthase TruB [Phnomibacter sp.]
MEKISQQQVLDGMVFLMNKPLEWTSFDVIGRMRKIFKIKKIGHAGTLDPLATGMLIVCTGKFTKKINEYMGMEKEYTGTITLGASTPTYDLESEPANFKPYEHITAEQVEQVLQQFRGPIEQIPPAHSAIKIDGKRVYELARKGQEVNLKPRPVTIHSFEITEMALPLLHFKVVCSTGTYIRSLANDVGAALGTGGYLSSLCRTRIGEFKLEDSLSIEDVIEQFDSSTVPPKLPKN